MAVNNFHFKLDIEREDHIPKFRLKQYDTAIFYASLYKNGLPYHFENEKIKMFVKKADGTIVYQEDNITIQDDEVKINVKNQALTASGLTYAELEFKSLSGQVTTATFVFDVREKVGSDKAIESVTDISTLEKLDKYIGQAKKELDKFKKDLANLEDLVANKNTLEKQNTDARVNVVELGKIVDQANGIVSDAGKKINKNNIVVDTVNGYVQDIYFKGKTLFNIIPLDPSKWVLGSGTGGDLGINGYYQILLSSLQIKPNTNYSYRLFGLPEKYNSHWFHLTASNRNTSTQGTFTSLSEIGESFIHLYPKEGQRFTLDDVKNVKIVLVEGNEKIDTYFEGIKSIGDGVDNIEISTFKAENNLFNPNECINGKYVSDGGALAVPSSPNNPKDYNVAFIKVPEGDFSINVSGLTNSVVTGDKFAYMGFYDNNKNPIDYKYFNVKNPYTKTFTNSDIGFVAVTVKNEDIKSLNITLSTDLKPYTESIYSKKNLLYYDPIDKVWKKPIVRGINDSYFDYICERNGKTYYHKKCKRKIISGSENWGIDAGQSTGTKSKMFVLFQSDLGNNVPLICDKFLNTSIYGKDNIEGISIVSGAIRVRVFNNKLVSNDEEGFKQFCKKNNFEVVYPTTKEEVYECLDVSPRVFRSKTLFSINSGAISPRELNYYVPISFAAADNSICEKLENIDLNSFDLNSIKLPGLNLKDSLDTKYLNINKGDIFNFNETIEPGRYSVGSETTLPGAPFPNSIYGSLIVLPRRGKEKQQIFLTIDGYISSRFLNYQGSWSDWYRIPKLNDFEGKNSQTNGYQKFPNGTIIQWGSTIIKFDGYRAHGYLYYPIAFSEYAHCTGNVASNSYGGYCETTGTVSGDNLTRGYAEALDFESKNENGKDVRIQWIAIGR
ncbi:MAG: BppU family phage baseplate upper protein [Clostridiales bacterium]|nr:hypothetical protein RSJ16_07440 [Paeniclostridium sordellii]MDU5019066.1 BppU family phage baseplate upper protein [Clostridiales bacterium]